MFFVCTYMVGSIFMSVYGIAIESIMQCFILDESLNENGDPLDNCPEPLLEYFKENQPQKQEWFKKLF